MKAAWTIVSLLVVGGCAEPNLNEYVPRTGIITGEILFQGPAPAAVPEDDCPDRGPDRGNVVVTLFAIDDPPPPDGRGQPVNVVIVPAERLFAGDVLDGLFSATYTIPTVAPGTYQVRAFMDRDGDFNPGLALLTQPGAGDVVGGHIDSATGAFLPVEVDADENVGQVSILLGQALSVERPVFTVTSSLSFSVDGESPGLVLEASPVRRRGLCFDPARTAFVVEYADANGDGRPEDGDGDGLLDLFPQVILRQIDDVVSGVSVVVPGIVDRTPFADRLADGERIPTSRLRVGLAPAAFAVAPDGTRQALPGVPSGRYEVVVVLRTGQTWQVPNAFETLPSEDDDSTCPADLSVCPAAVEGCPCVCPDPAGADSCADDSLPTQCRCLELEGDVVRASIRAGGL